MNPGPAFQTGRVKWLRVQRAADLLGVSASTLRRWADSGKVPSRRTPGDQRVFSADDLLPLLTLRAGSDEVPGRASARQEQDRKLALLLEATRAVTSTLVLEDVLELVARTTAEAMGTFAADIFDYSMAENAMIASGYWALDITPEDEEYLGFHIYLDERPGYYPYIDEPRLLERQLDDEDWPPGEREIAARWDEKSSLVVPLMFGGELIGLLGCTEKRYKRRFSREDKEFLELLAVPAALAIRNARVFREQQERVRMMATLRDCGRAVASSLHIDEVLAALARKAAEALGSRECLIFDCDVAYGTLTAKALYEEDPRPREDLGMSFPLAASPSFRAILEGRRVVVETVSDPSIPEDSRASMERSGDQTRLNVPLYFGDEPLGILVLIETRRERVFSREEIELISAVAEQAAVAIHNARLYEEVKHLHLGNLRALSSALSAKDYYTLGHASRVAAYMALLGRELGWPQARLAEVENVAFLHDIGKIGVSDRVLLKAGPLTSEEWELVRQHPGISAEIVRPLFDDELVAGVRHHHERFDGSGYPDGLAGEAIPLIARAMCVVDCYDAMSCERPYRRALSYRQCLAELRRCAGTQFDPQMVAALRAALQRLQRRRARVAKLAQWAAQLVDPAIHARLRVRADEELPEYRQAVNALRAFRDAHSPVRFITSYAMVGDRCITVLDTGETEDEVSHCGDPWLAEDDLARVLAGDDMVANVLTADDFGVWVSSAAPVRDPEDAIVGAVTVDAPVLESLDRSTQAGRSHTLAGMLQAAAIRYSRAEVEAITDGLTGLYNHRYLHERLEEELERARRRGTPLSLLFCDCDYFKAYNDSHGHKAGDAALVRIARTIEACTRRVDLAARYGGEEFVLVLVDTGDSEALAVAERLRAAIEASSARGGQPLTVSIGIATCPDDASVREELLDKADWAMYTAKRAGRNRVLAFSDGLVREQTWLSRRGS
jgi:diguanylate cyclase (GGDEF)-like protein/excisionase family DNA binding protein